MRRLYIIGFILAVLMAGRPLSAGETYRFRMTPIFGRTFGETQYELKLTGLGEDGLSGIKSRLEFPLDYISGGARLTLDYHDDLGCRWIFAAGITVGLNNPYGIMKDHDWAIAAGYGDYKWSYTESEAEMNLVDIHLSAARRLYSWNRTATYFTAGIAYRRVVQDIIGYTGWQIDLDDPALPRRTVQGDRPALYYRVEYLSPLAGLLYRYETTSGLTFDLSAAYLLVLAEDYDDHLLRFKTSVGDGIGHGFCSMVAVRYLPLVRSSGPQPFLELRGDLTALRVNGNQTQRWYGDDPAGEGDETGQSIGGIPHEFVSTQLALGFSLGIAF